MVTVPPPPWGRDGAGAPKDNSKIPCAPLVRAGDGSAEMVASARGAHASIAVNVSAGGRCFCAREAKELTVEIGDGSKVRRSAALWTPPSRRKPP